MARCGSALRWLGWAGASVALLACNAILGIGDPQLDPGSGGGGATGGAGGTTAVGGAGGQQPPPPCQPDDPVCNQVDSDCLALTDNRGKTLFGMRVSQVTMWKPDVFKPPGLEAAAIQQSVGLNWKECYLTGSGTLSWLIEFDTSLHRGRVGASRPVADPFAGYTFVDEVMEEKEKLRVMVHVFGRATPVVLDYTNVEKA